MIELTFLKEWIILKQVHYRVPYCHYWYFLNMGFQPYVCNGCHDVLMMSMNLAILLFLKIMELLIFSAYNCFFTEISKSEAMKLMQNIDLSKKK